MPKPRGPFASLICPYCGGSDASFMVVLSDLERLECRECSESFTIQQAVVRAEQVLLGWSAYERLTKLAPAVADDAPEPPPPSRRRHHDSRGEPATLDLSPADRNGFDAPRGYRPGEHYGDGEDVPARAGIKVNTGE